MGIAYAIIVGLGAVLGTLVPLFFERRAPINGHAKDLILMGVAVMVAGITLTALGGHVRERYASAIAQTIPQQKYVAAVSLAILCGFMAPMLNYSFAFGQDIALQSINFGNSAVHAGYAVWPVGLLDAESTGCPRATCSQLVITGQCAHRTIQIGLCLRQVAVKPASRTSGFPLPNDATSS
jgi:hypothetical protein